MNYFTRKYKIIIKIVIPASFFVFFVSLNLQDRPHTWGWQKQVVNVLPAGNPIQDITFVDSLIGYAVTYKPANNDTNYILKTTNGGFNWQIIRMLFEYNTVYRIIFLNQNTGYIAGFFGSVAKVWPIEKTTNGGNNWFQINFPPQNTAEDLFVLNEDTIWLANSYPGSGGLWKTTNGGINWQKQYPGDNPTNIYMYNSRIGFAYHYGYNNMSKTTDGGASWIDLNVVGFKQMYFVDSITGYKADGTFAKTTDGGFNWYGYDLPDIPGASWSNKMINNFSKINDTIVLVGAYGVFPPGYQVRSVIYKTINNGLNWGFQTIDTGFFRGDINFCRFITGKKGWCYGTNKGLYTTSGGDTTFYLDVKDNRNSTLKNYQLFQNYPNPFNPSTNIKYQLFRNSFVLLKVYNILGKEISTLVDGKQKAGIYEVQFNGKDIFNNSLSGGAYFYKIEVTNENGNVFTETKKMILIK